MRQLIASAAALLVAACGAEATADNAVAERNDAVSGAAVAARPESWAGAYRAFFDGADGTITIDPSSGSNPTYNVVMAMANEGCTGEALGSGTAKGNRMSVIVPVGSTAGWQECRITLTRRAEGLAVSETSNCRELHGSTCAFSGIAKKAGGKVGPFAAQPSASGTTELGAGRSFMEEGGAVGCPNGPIKGRATRVADRISANDECGDVGVTASANGPSWANGEIYSAVRAREDPNYFIQHACITDSRGRSDGFSIGRGDPDQGTNSGTPDGQKFLTALGTKVRSAELQIFVPGQPARTMKFARAIESDADWGFNSWADKATLAAIKKASHYRLQLGGRTLTFSGRGGAQAIAATYCQQDFHN